MNNNFVKFAFVGIACAAFCATAFAAPRGGHHGGSGGPARPPQQMRPPHGGNGHPARPPQQMRPPQVARPAPKPSVAKHSPPAHHVNPPPVGRPGHFRHEPRHHALPHHVVRHHIPSHAHYWARPAVPLWRVGALRAWEWIEQEWMIVVNGVYYYGDGYYYDGYNYYYNGEYHTVPPPLLYI